MTIRKSLSIILLLLTLVPLGMFGVLSYFYKLQTSEADARVLLQGRTILIVDDIEINQEWLRDLLSYSGAQCKVAVSADDAIRLIEQENLADQNFTLIVDKHMPDKDGYDLVRYLIDKRIHPNGIMMLSSSAEDGDSQQCKILGIDQFKLKPINEKALITAIADIITKQEDAARKKTQTDDETHKTKQALTSKHVLVAEDTKVNQIIIEELLASLGANVTIVENGLQAVESFSANPFDLLLLDIQMPIMDGLQAAREIRKSECTDQCVPIIAITANVYPEHRKACFDAGMDGFIPKPFDITKIEEVLSTII